MFVVSMAMFVILTLISILPLPQVEGILNNNMTFYVMLLIFTFSCQNLVRNTFNLGYLTFTDETKFELFLGAKSFLVVYILLKYADTSEMFDFQITKLHEDLVSRINDALFPFGVSPRIVAIDLTVLIFSMIATLITFSIVKIQTRFAFYFYSFTTKLKQ